MRKRYLNWAKERKQVQYVLATFEDAQKKLEKHAQFKKEYRSSRQSILNPIPEVEEDWIEE